MKRATLIAALLLPTGAAAQSLPNPCEALGQVYAVKFCLAREAALMDSVYVVTARAVADAQPDAVRDSLVAGEARWSASHDSAMGRIGDPTGRLAANLVAKRSRVFLLRHQLLVAAAAADTSRMRRPPVIVTWRQEQQGRGLVLVLTNTSNSPLDLYARLYNPYTDRLQVREVNILRNANVRIGWLEDWPWEPGQHLQLLTPRFAPYHAVAAVGTAR